MYSAHRPVPFQDESCLFYTKTSCVPRSKHSPPRLHKTSLLMLYKAKVAVCSQICTQPIKETRPVCRIFLIVNLAVPKVTARLWKVKIKGGGEVTWRQRLFFFFYRRVSSDFCAAVYKENINYFWVQDRSPSSGSKKVLYCHKYWLRMWQRGSCDEKFKCLCSLYSVTHLKSRS